MVGTFISKYLLVTTSTITVTSSAAVTFFVAKHLKVGKNCEKAMDYIEKQYRATYQNYLDFKNDESGLIKEIAKTLSVISSDCTTDHEKNKLNCSSEIDKFNRISDDFIQKLTKHKEILIHLLNIKEIEKILGESAPALYEKK